MIYKEKSIISIKNIRYLSIRYCKTLMVFYNIVVLFFNFQVMQKITPHLWFDKEAKEAAEFYVSVFGKDSKIIDVTQLHETPSGSVDLVSFDLWWQSFMSISAWPYFQINPSISFTVNCSSIEETTKLWEKLSQWWMIMMPFDSYPFSEKYWWAADKYGVSWQIMYSQEPNIQHKIVPSIMFIGDLYERAEEAINFYTSIFNNSHIDYIFRYDTNAAPNREWTVAHAGFTLEWQNFNIMENAFQHGFAFNEGISLIINCDDQEQIDYYWEKLSADSSAEQCGWLKDKYGVSWQVNPTIMSEMMASKDPAKIARVTQAFLQMKKFDIATLKRAYEWE